MQLNLQDEVIMRLLPVRLFVEPTLACNVGCAFCKYSAKSFSNSRSSHRLPDIAVEAIRAYSSSHPLGELVITGGGEPTYEMDLVKLLLYDISADQATIYTAAQWADTSDHAAEVIDALERVCRSVKRPLMIRLSIDTFHAKTLGDDILHNVLAAASTLGHDKEAGLISYGIRTVIGQETYLEALVKREGGTVFKDSPSTGSAILPTSRNRFDVPILFKGIVPLGRMKAKRASQLHILSPAQLRMAYAKELGTGWPITYKGGWNAGVRWSGDVYLYGGSPVEYGSLTTGMPLLDAFCRMAADPLNYIAAAKGFATLYELLHEFGLLNDSLINVLHDPSLYLPMGLSDPQSHSKARVAASEYLARDALYAAKISGSSLAPGIDRQDPRKPPVWEQASPGPLVTAHAVQVALGEYKGRVAMAEGPSGSSRASQDQTIGTIRGSRNVRVAQTMNTDASASQKLGDVIDAEDIHIEQNIRAVVQVAAEIDPEHLARIDKEELRSALGSLLSHTLSVEQIEAAARRAHSTEPDTPVLSSAINALATSAAVVSGVLTIGALTNPIALAIAAPAALVLAHVVDPEPVLHFFSWLKRRLS